ncbi:MAG: hypothetical protein PVG39_04830 [Desulfobacteraceae bacterium]|jgi:hypothetical protein
MKKITDRIENKLNTPGLIDRLVSGLSNSDLNSFYMELFRKQCQSLTPSDVLKQYENSRFVTPSEIDAVTFHEFEIEWLKYAKEIGFLPIQLSPLALLGTCSVAARVDQNNIVSATRSTEVLSDATNVLALQVAGDFKIDRSKRNIRYCTSNRNTRAQYFSNPAFTAHFGVFNMVTGGYDRGGFEFELENIIHHLRFYYERLQQDFSNDLILKIHRKIDNDVFESKLINSIESILDGVKIVKDESDNTDDYYQTVRIKISVKHGEQEIHIVDMGFVDWTQKLLNNKKQRLLTSGAGLELLLKIKSGLI